MTEKELHKLHKTELLELLLEMRSELDRLHEENTALEEKLEAASAQRALLEQILGIVEETAAQVKGISAQK